MADGMSAESTMAERFGRDGFAVIPSLAHKGDLVTLRTAYDDLLAGRVDCGEDARVLGGLTTQFVRPHLHHETFRSNAVLERGKDVVRAITGAAEPLFVFSQLLYKPAGHPHETPWHQDMAYAYMPFARAGTHWPGDAILQFWVALDDVDETMGCMEFIPGVQDRPMAPHIVSSGDPTRDERLLAIDDPRRWLELESAVRCPLPAGSATVHGYTTPHYTGPNRSTRGRRAYIFSYADPARLAALSPSRSARADSE